MKMLYTIILIWCWSTEMMLLTVSLYLFTCTGLCSGVVQTFTYQANTTCDENIELFLDAETESKSGSAIACAVSCSGKAGCGGFLYFNGTKACHSVNADSPMLGACALPGAMFYKDPVLLTTTKTPSPTTHQPTTKAMTTTTPTTPAPTTTTTTTTAPTTTTPTKTTPTTTTPTKTTPTTTAPTTPTKTTPTKTTPTTTVPTTTTPTKTAAAPTTTTTTTAAPTTTTTTTPAPTKTTTTTTAPTTTAPTTITQTTTTPTTTAPTTAPTTTPTTTSTTTAPTTITQTTTTPTTTAAPTTTTTTTPTTILTTQTLTTALTTTESLTAATATTTKTPTTQSLTTTAITTTTTQETTSCNGEPTTLVHGLADDQLTASSFFSGRDPHWAKYSKGFYWKALTNDLNQFLQVDFMTIKTVVSMTTRGGRSKWVTSYKVAISDNCSVFEELTGTEGNVKIFSGNINESDSVTNNLEQPVHARCVRINPVTWQHSIVLKLEINGC